MPRLRPARTRTQLKSASQRNSSLPVSPRRAFSVTAELQAADQPFALRLNPTTRVRTASGFCAARRTAPEPCPTLSCSTSAHRRRQFPRATGFTIKLRGLIRAQRIPPVLKEFEFSTRFQNGEEDPWASSPSPQRSPRARGRDRFRRGRRRSGLHDNTSRGGQGQARRHIVVPPRTYRETVHVLKDNITILGSEGAIIDARGFPNGIHVGAEIFGQGPNGIPFARRWRSRTSH